MFGLRGPELLIIAIVVVILFGSAFIPRLSRMIGKALGGFKGSMKNAEKEFREGMSEGEDKEGSTGS